MIALHDHSHGVNTNWQLFIYFYVQPAMVVCYFSEKFSIKDNYHLRIRKELTRINLFFNYKYCLNKIADTPRYIFKISNGCHIIIKPHLLCNVHSPPQGHT